MSDLETQTKMAFMSNRKAETMQKEEKRDLIDEAFMLLSLFGNVLSLLRQHLFALHSLFGQHLPAFNSLFGQHLLGLNNFLQQMNQNPHILLLLLHYSI